MLSNKLAIGSRSLGQHQSHGLDDKIRAAAEHGYAGIEIVYFDLQDYCEARSLSLTAGAQAIRQLCSDAGVEILSLAPFENFEGDMSPLTERLARAEHWIDIARTLGAPWLQVPANYRPDSSGDDQVIASDLRQLCDLGSAKSPLVSFAYEPMSWSTHVPTWERTLAILEAVGRPNIGLCLDSFHILTRLWGSPHVQHHSSGSGGGKYPHADATLDASMARFVADFPLDKIAYVQLSDAERLDPPWSPRHPWYVEGEAAEFTWSRHARPFPGEADLGAYLPVGRFVKACVADKKFNGWVSMEIFDRRMREPDQAIIRQAAARGTDSWAKMQSEVTGSSSSELSSTIAKL